MTASLQIGESFVGDGVNAAHINTVFIHQCLHCRIIARRVFIQHVLIRRPHCHFNHGL